MLLYYVTYLAKTLLCFWSVSVNTKGHAVVEFTAASPHCNGLP